MRRTHRPDIDAISVSAPGSVPASVPDLRQLELRGIAGSRQLFSWTRRPGRPSLVLEGQDSCDTWLPGPLVALDPTVVLDVVDPRDVEAAVSTVDRLVAARTAAGGTSETGLAVLLAFDLFQPDAADDAGFPRIVALSVDRSLRYTGPDTALLTTRQGAGQSLTDQPRLRDQLESLPVETKTAPPARSTGPARTTLPRERYLRAVERVRRHIARGDIYQANLSQRIEAPYRGDAFELFADLAERTPAPHAAFLETSNLALASLSPETFLRMRKPGELETYPIKGTRPRGATPEEDRAAARGLLNSEKDRAELLMIVDLERNDLSRVCYPGSVRVGELGALKTFPSVHHLVASVSGRVRPETGVRDLLRATFPGGSITGAPKIRAMQILREMEPAPRNFFTGCLLWFGDDATLDSSILIRTLVFGGERVFLGAGGGIVADSEPEAEWEESNHKARSLAAALGFDPREAS